jgi:hypothetical protein
MNIEQTPIKHYQLAQPKFDESTFRITADMVVKMADFADNAIVDAIIDEAKKSGLTDAYLIDKKYIIAALSDYAARLNPQPLTLEEVTTRCEKPLYIVPLDKGADWTNCWSVMGIDWVTAKSDTVKGRIYFMYEQDYGITWLAYDYPPKEEA